MSNCLNCTCECIPDPGDDGQPERVDHAARADQHLLNATRHDTLDADQNLVAAQAEATLALADQQEIANLIAFLDHVDGDDDPRPRGGGSWVSRIIRHRSTQPCVDCGAPREFVPAGQPAAARCRPCAERARAAEPLTVADLDAIAQRWSDLPGPDEWSHTYGPLEHPCIWGDADDAEPMAIVLGFLDPDDAIRVAAALASARADLPALVAEVRRLQTEAEATRRERDALKARNDNWQLWADNLTPRCCCGNCEDR